MAKFARIEVINSIYDLGLVPVFYHKNLEMAKKIVNACADGGARVVEFTNRGDRAYQIFSELVSYFEKEKEAFYNSLLVIDTDGKMLDNYRKTHIPDGPGYEEKFYFTPGDSGFKVWDTAYGRIGAGICWDQWFPETARSLALMGAELIFYPTAIGSEPEIGVDSKDHWQRVQMGHSAANTIPVIAANRIGLEEGESCSLTFYGSSFMTDYTGAKIAEASRDSEEIIYAEYDLKKNKEQREYWGLLRDRRPECYTTLTQ